MTQTELLISSEMPDHPWQKVVTDLFEWQQYLLVVDYYSRFIETAKLSSTTYLSECHQSSQQYLFMTRNT